MKRHFLLLVPLILSFCTCRVSPPVALPNETPVQTLIEMLGDDEKSEAAFDRLLEIGLKAVPALEKNLFHKEKAIAFGCGDLLIAIEQERLSRARDEATPEMRQTIETLAALVATSLPTSSGKAWKQALKERLEAVRDLLAIGDPAILDLAEAVASGVSEYDPKKINLLLAAHRDLLGQLARSPERGASVLRMMTILDTNASATLAALTEEGILGPYEVSTEKTMITNRSSVPYLRRLLGREERVQYKAAYMLLGYFSDWYAAPPLLAIAEDSDDFLRRQKAVWACVSALRHPAAAEILVRWMGDSDPNIRLRAITLARISQMPELLPHIIKRFTSEEDKVREEAVNAFIFLADRSLEKPLEALIRHEADPQILGIALRYLMFFPSEAHARLLEEKLPALLTQLAVEDDPQRRSSLLDYYRSGVIILGEFGYPSSRPFLRTLLVHKSALIRASAASSLVRCGEASARKALKDTFTEVKALPREAIRKKQEVGQLIIQAGEDRIVSDLLAEAARTGKRDLASLAFRVAVPNTHDQKAILDSKTTFEQWWHANRETYYRSVVEKSIERLSGDSQMRTAWHEDIQRVRRLTGRDFGYNPLDPRPKRFEALGRLKAWFKENKNDMSWDPSRRLLTCRPGQAVGKPTRTKGP